MESIEEAASLGVSGFILTMCRIKTISCQSRYSRSGRESFPSFSPVAVIVFLFFHRFVILLVVPYYDRSAQISDNKNWNDSEGDKRECSSIILNDPNASEANIETKFRGNNNLKKSCEYKDNRGISPSGGLDIQQSVRVNSLDLTIHGMFQKKADT